jgi:diguanylate cyclase (GGDEF)-like protein/hemerythrin-like metal-binding protein
MGVEAFEREAVRGRWPSAACGARYLRAYALVAASFLLLVACLFLADRRSDWAYGSIAFFVGLAAVFHWLALAESRREAGEVALRSSLALLVQSQQIGKVGGWEVDAGSGKVTLTEQVYRILEVDPHYDPRDIGKDMAFCAPDSQFAISRAIERAVTLGDPFDLEVRFTAARGTHKWVRVSARAQVVDGKVRRVFGDIQDITDRKLAEARMGYLANHDRLTELPNRELFKDRLSQAISRAARKRERFAVLLLDLDDFKPINDKHGHAAGDVALIMVARRLQACLRHMDTVARLGGDEFAIILDDLQGPDDAKQVAQKIIRSLSEPLHLADAGESRIGVSIGISMYPDDGSEIDKLVQAADDAMYRSKACGKGVFTLSARGGNATPSDRAWINLDDSLLLGMPEFDRQHQVVASMLNDLNAAIKTGDMPLADAARLFDQLIEYVRCHFSAEDSQMEHLGYPDRDAHQMAHRRLLDEAAFLREKFVEGRELFALQSLKDWFVPHIASYDRAFAAYVAGKGQAAAAPLEPVTSGT